MRSGVAMQRIFLARASIKTDARGGGGHARLVEERQSGIRWRTAEMELNRADIPTLRGCGGEAPKVTVINFAHPLTRAQVAACERLSGWHVEHIVAVPTHCDLARPFAEQAAGFVEAAGLTSEQWQSCRLAIVPPALSPVACLVIAEIHGRAGYFVPVVRLRPRFGGMPPVFEVAEILDVQGQREAARARR